MKVDMEVNMNLPTLLAKYARGTGQPAPGVRCRCCFNRRQLKRGDRKVSRHRSMLTQKVYALFLDLM